MTITDIPTQRVSVEDSKLALKVKPRDLQPTVSHFINYGSKEKPRGEVYFTAPDERLVVGFSSGRVWARRGGFGLKEAHLRAAYRYLIMAGLARYNKFARDRIGKSPR